MMGKQKGDFSQLCQDDIAQKNGLTVSVVDPDPDPDPKLFAGS
jgi:hypothetical protein